MEASVQSDDKFQRVPPDPQKINWEFWSWEDGGWLVQLAWFSACPHMTVPRPELADAASLCSCHRCVFQSRWSCQWEDDSVLTAAPPSLFRASQINMLGFKAATADIGHWVRGPNAEQKHSRPLVTCSQWAWSPRRGTHSAWAVHRAPRGPALTHCLLGELCMPPSASDSHHSFFIFWASLWLTRWRARNNEKSKQFKEAVLTERDSAERGGGKGGATSARWLTLRRNAFLHAISPSLVSEGGGRRKADCCHVSRAATAAPDTQMIIFIGDLVYYWVAPACVSLCHQDWQRSKSEGRLCVDVSFFLFPPCF